MEELKCPDCGLNGRKGYVKVGPLRWWGIECASCNGIYSTGSLLWGEVFRLVFARFWDGAVHIPCEEHGGN